MTSLSVLVAILTVTFLSALFLDFEEAVVFRNPSTAGLFQWIAIIFLIATAASLLIIGRGMALGL